MDPYSKNGSFIGQTMDFGTTDRYISGYDVTYNTLVYVGGTTFSTVGTTVNLTYGLTSLGGGIASSPAPTDLVIAVWSQAFRSYTLPAYNLSGFTQVFNTISNFTYGVWVVAGRAWGATSITIPNGTGDGTLAGSLVVHVWRNVDLTNPIDNVTYNSRASASPYPPAINTVVNNSVVVVVGGSGHNRGVASFGSDASNFRVATGNDTYDTTLGIGSYLVSTAGTRTPSLWTFSDVDSGLYSAIGGSIVLRPSSVTTPIYGNNKNSGIWDLQSVYKYKAGL